MWPPESRHRWYPSVYRGHPLRHVERRSPPPSAARDSNGGSSANDHVADGRRHLPIRAAGDVFFFQRQPRLVDHDDSVVNPLDSLHHGRLQDNESWWKKQNHKRIQPRDEHHDQKPSSAYRFLSVSIGGPIRLRIHAKSTSQRADVAQTLSLYSAGELVSGAPQRLLKEGSRRVLDQRQARLPALRLGHRKCELILACALSS